MKQSVYQYHSQKLQDFMERVGCRDLKELSRISGVSEWELQRVRHGLLHKLSVENLIKLTVALRCTVNDLLRAFQLPETPAEIRYIEVENTEEVKLLKKQYDDLEGRLRWQELELKQQFQKNSIEAIESWLLQWPTAEAVARKNPQLAAIKIIALVKPIVQLLKTWGVEQIHNVGDRVNYDPALHQTIEGTTEPGTPVLVRYVGYRHGDKLLYRAKVSVIKEEESVNGNNLAVTGYN